MFSFYLPFQWGSAVNPIALRRVKTLWSFGPFECNMVKGHYLLHYRRRFFLLTADQFLGRIFVVQGGNQEVTRVVSLRIKMTKYNGNVSIHIKIIYIHISYFFL